MCNYFCTVCNYSEAVMFGLCFGQKFLEILDFNFSVVNISECLCFFKIIMITFFQ